MGLSKRQVLLKYGFNAALLETLITEGVLTLEPGGNRLRQQIDPDSLSHLKEPEHYVVCRCCGALQALVHATHLQQCSGISVKEYTARFPAAPVLSKLCARNKSKTPEQKLAQSETLKARFQTPEGETTRLLIAENARRVMLEGYKAQATAHLLRINQSPEGRERARKQAVEMYASGVNHAKDWHHDHREESLSRAAHARRFNTRKCTKPHMTLKAALEAGGVTGFVTECEVGYYAIDEARPDIRLAVEMDGCYWHGCVLCGFEGHPGNQRTYKSKETFLTRRGWQILHIMEHDVKADLPLCVQRVREAVASRLETPTC